MNRIHLAPLAALILFPCAVSLSLGAPLPWDVDVIDLSSSKMGPSLSVADVLQNRAGLDLMRTGSFGSPVTAKLRGASSEETAVLLDGQPLGFLFDAQTDLSQIPLDLIDRIEITRGGSSLRNMAGGAGGSINLITLHPEETGLKSYVGTGIGRYGLKHHHGRFQLRSRIGDLTYVGQLADSNNFLAHEGLSSTDHFGKWSRSFGDGRGFTSLNFLYHESDVDRPFGTLAPYETWNGHEERISSQTKPIQRQTWQSVGGLFHLKDVFGGRLQLESSGRWRDAELETDSGTPDLRHQKNQSIYSKVSWMNSMLDIGVDRDDRKRDLETVPTRSDFETGIYAIGTIQRTRWLLKEGLRFQRLDTGETLTLPRTTFIWDGDKPLSFSLSTQRTVRTPTWDELAVSSAALANPDLKAERGWSHSLGVGYTPTEARWSVQATGFMAAHRNAIALNGSNQWENLGKVERKGGEIGASFSWGQARPWSSGSFSMNATAQAARFKTSGQGTDVEAALVPKHLANARLETQLPRKWSLVNQWTYESEQFERIDRQGLRIPPHARWDATIHIQIVKADLYMTLQNVTNAHVADSLSRTFDGTGAAVSALNPLPGRTFFTGIRIRFDN